MPSTQTIRFTKMHGLGNDFAVINNITPSISLKHLPILRLANRYLGIGFDQLLLIETSQHADFFCRIINADGSEAEQCGNGLRCVARFIVEENLTAKKSFRLETKAGVFPVLIHDYQSIQVSMGEPIFDNTYELSVAKPVMLSVLSMGNPHAIVQVPSVEDTNVAELGPQIEAHSSFPLGVNVGFMEVVNRQHIRLRTFERGVGETLACGSNACAAAVAGIQNKILDSTVKVELIFGNLFIEWLGAGNPVIMTGPASSVYQGTFNL